MSAGIPPLSIPTAKAIARTRARSTHLPTMRSEVHALFVFCVREAGGHETWDRFEVTRRGAVESSGRSHLKTHKPVEQGTHVGGNRSIGSLDRVGAAFAFDRQSVVTDVGPSC